MHRADLYLLSTPSMSDQIDFVCRLCEKAVDEYQRIHIQTEQSLQNEALDTALWTFKAESFLPHEIVFPDKKPLAPILIDTRDMNEAYFLDTNLLILLSNALPENVQRYDRLCIVVPNHEADIQQARQLYRQLSLEKIDVRIHDRR
jgi:DNA polymerase-3 subunit chi